MVSKLNCPLVSLLIPVYNVARYITQCLDSLFGQTYEYLEFVFVDDCSPDNSINLIYQYLEQYPHRKSQVKIIRHDKNRGLTAARRTALQNATGEYVWHIDSDDYIAIDAVEQLVNKAVADNADMIVFDAKEMYFHSERVIVNTIPKDKEEFLLLALTRRCRYELWMRFCKKSLYDGLELDDAVCYGEDYATTPRLIYLSNKVVKLDKICYYYVKYNMTSYTRTPSVATILSHEGAIHLLTTFFLSKDEKHFYPILQLAKAYLKAHMLKATISSKDAYRRANLMFPDLRGIGKMDLPPKDKFLLMLSEKKMYSLLWLYIELGLLLRKITH